MAQRLILAGVTIILLNAFVLFSLLDHHLRQDLTALTSNQLLTLANYVAAQVDRDIVQRRELLEQLAKQIPLALLNDHRALAAWLAERHAINPLFSEGLVVLDQRGAVLTDYPPVPGRRALMLADRDCFQRAMQGEFAMGRPVFSTVSKVPVLPMAMPVQDAAGTVQAVLIGVAGLKSANFIEALYDTRVGATGGFVLVSPRDRLFLGSSDCSITLTPTPKTGLHRQHDQAMLGFRGVGIDVNAAGIEELAAIASVPASGWFLVARIPTHELFAPIERLRHFMLWASVSLALVLLLVMAIGLRQQLRPLREAAHHAERMTRGESVFAPLPVRRNDEVGHLTTAFNRVLENLLESRAEMEYLARHDGLTGLPNRQLLATHIQHARARAQRHGYHLAILYLDLDGFKAINDGLGHGAGDCALRETAQRLSGVLRTEDTLARIGGDEFVILLSDLEPEHAREITERVADKCLSVFEQPLRIDDHDCRLGTSIGLTLDAGERTLDALLTAADTAMYRAKESGRGRFCWGDVYGVKKDDYCDKS